jgi:hypothetical protein
MCEGGVVTWMRSCSVSSSASHQWPMAARSDPWVCLTALGSPVVPELNTRTASACRSGVRLGGAGRGGGGYGVVEVQHRHEAGEDRVVAHRVGGLGDRERVLGVGPLPRRAAQHDRGAQPPDRLDRDDPLRTVRAHQRYPVPWPHAALCQCGGEAVRQGVELRVRVPLCFERERDALAFAFARGARRHREGVFFSENYIIDFLESSYQKRWRLASGGRDDAHIDAGRAAVPFGLSHDVRRMT